ncbi:transcriptional regulator [Saccharibacillus sp. O16]|nr:transcriptional regulator [Saccharibacillus sp. O16]
MEKPEKGYESPYTCPVAVTVDVIGGKWKGIVLHHLIEGPVRFNELRRLMPGTTQRILTLQLRELERDGLVHREIYHQVPPKVEYSLTSFGRTLIPILDLMRSWGMEHERDIVDRRNI